MPVRRAIDFNSTVLDDTLDCLRLSARDVQFMLQPILSDQGIIKDLTVNKCSAGRSSPKTYLTHRAWASFVQAINVTLAAFAIAIFIVADISKAGQITYSLRAAVKLGQALQAVAPKSSIFQKNLGTPTSDPA
jgi:hypothetical protein